MSRVGFIPPSPLRSSNFRRIWKKNYQVLDTVVFVTVVALLVLPRPEVFFFSCVASVVLCVLCAVQAALGLDRVRIMVTGSAPVATHVLTFMRILIGVPLLEG